MDIIDSFKDRRIVHTRGTPDSAMISDVRNLGIDSAQGIYIAWMDSDDISLPERLKTEVEFMETHPAIDIAGSYAKTFGKRGGIVMRNPVSNDELKASVLFNASMVNPTTIMRLESLKKTGFQYAKGLKYCEDLDFLDQSRTCF